MAGQVGVTPPTRKRKKAEAILGGRLTDIQICTSSSENQMKAGLSHPLLQRVRYSTFISTCEFLVRLALSNLGVGRGKTTKNEKKRTKRTRKGDFYGLKISVDRKP